MLLMCSAQDPGELSKISKKFPNKIEEKAAFSPILQKDLNIFRVKFSRVCRKNTIGLGNFD